MTTINHETAVYQDQDGWWFSTTEGTRKGPFRSETHATVDYFYYCVLKEKESKDGRSRQDVV